MRCSEVGVLVTGCSSGAAVTAGESFAELYRWCQFCFSGSGLPRIETLFSVPAMDATAFYDAPPAEVGQAVQSSQRFTFEFTVGPAAQPPSIVVHLCLVPIVLPLLPQ